MDKRRNEEMAGCSMCTPCMTATILLIDHKQRDLHPQAGDTREQLLERVKANLRIPRRTSP